jgi:hypothetical protein
MHDLLHKTAWSAIAAAASGPGAVARTAGDARGAHAADPGAADVGMIHPHHPLCATHNNNMPEHLVAATNRFVQRRQRVRRVPQIA